jgi:hypothetical protein
MWKSFFDLRRSVNLVLAFLIVSMEISQYSQELSFDMAIWGQMGGRVTSPLYRNCFELMEQQM